MLQSSHSILLLGAILAGALPAHTGPTDSDVPQCGVTEVEYVLSATLQITDTMMGAGDGVHVVGPGRALVRFDGRSGARRASLLAYDLRESFTVVSSVLFWATRVRSHLRLSASRAPASVADGAMVGQTLRWEGRANGPRTDGTLDCEGFMCGKFGAPPSGTSEVHDGPTSIELAPFQFSPDMKTFTMPFALLSKSDSPKQRTLVSIAGREVQRTCVRASAVDPRG